MPRADLLAFPQRVHGVQVLGQGRAEFHDRGLVEHAPHSTATVAVDGREFLYCLTCADAGHDIALELFTDDRDGLLCPVDAANRVLRATVDRLWHQTVGHALRAGGREAKQLESLLRGLN